MSDTKCENRHKSIIFVSYITIFGNAALAISKITVGIFAGSFAVIGDGIDSSTDVAITLIALITAYIAIKPPDKEHIYGHRRAETIGTKILSFIMIFAGIEILMSSINKIISGDIGSIPHISAVIVIIISIISKSLLSLINFKIGKKVGSDLIVANAKNMRNDILLSFCVLIGLAATLLFKLPILDPILALIVSLWIIKTGIEIFYETSNELMDGVKDPVIYDRIFGIISTFPGAHNPHRVRVRKSGNLYDIDMNIEVNPQMTVLEAHEIAHSLECKLKKQIENIYDIVIHIEPDGSIEENESFGMNSEMLGKKD